MDQALGEAMAQQMLHATKIVEDQLDEQLNELDRLDEDGLEAIRQKRLQELKKESELKREYVKNGHGKYEELKDQKEFFDTCKKSQYVVCHFYRDSTERCKLLDKHLEKIAPKQLQTRFVKLNAEKSQFLCEKLKITVIPTLCIAKEGKTVDYIVGFKDLGNTDEFPTAMLVWRLACAGVAKYDGDLKDPPLHGNPKKPKGIVSSSIRGPMDDNMDDDDDW